MLKHEIQSNFYTSLNWLNSRKAGLPSIYLINYYKNIYAIAAPDLKKYIGQLYLNTLSTNTQHALDDLLLLFYQDSKDPSFLKLYFNGNHSLETYIKAKEFLQKSQGTNLLTEKHYWI